MRNIHDRFDFEQAVGEAAKAAAAKKICYRQFMIELFQDQLNIKLADMWFQEDSATPTQFENNYIV